MELREITGEEAPILTKLIKESVEADFPYSRKIRDYLMREELNIEEKLNIPAFTVWAAFQGGKPIAYLIALRPFGGISQIHWLGVAKKKQRQGIGKALLKTYISWAKKHGTHEIDLYALTNVVSFYEQLGFTKVAFLPKHYFGVDDYLMIKALQESKEENFLKS